jgi:microcin C transport system substrate-binding protein
MVKTAVAATAAQDGAIWARWAGVGMAVLALAGWAVAARAQDQKIIVSHGISTFGDLKYPADFKHLDYVNPDAPKGGEIAEWAQGSFDSLNPYSIKGVAGAGSTIYYENILGGTADEIGAAYCLLCTTMEYPEDRSWVIFNLRDDVTFSDGSPMTAEDVAFTFELFRTKGLSDFRQVFNDQFEGVEVLDPHKVKFTFKPGVPYRDLPATAGGLPIFSKAFYEANKLDLEESSLVPNLGTGPYVLDKMEAGQTLVYRLNPNYWGVNHPLNIGQNNFETIRYEYFADSNAAFEAFKSGEYTFRIENSSKSWATSYDFPAIEKGWVVKAELPSGLKANGQTFIFNLRQEKFQDPKVREAIGLMFNFEWSNETLFYGLYTRITSFWENYEMAAEGPPSPEEVALLKPLVDEGLLPAAILTDPPIEPASSGPEQLDRKNLRAASKLLDEAGWPVGDDGLRRNAAGEVLKVEFLNDNPAFDRIISPYVENLKALGVDATLETVDQAQFEKRTRGPKDYDFDMITSNTATSYEPGAEMLQYYGSATADISSFNAMGLKSPAVDRMIAVQMAAKTKEELTVASRAMDRVLLAERFWVPQWYKNVHTVAYYDMFEHPEVLPPYVLGELSFWWYNAEKAEKLKAAGAFQ